ncbi:menaquinone biosynthesis decarboxylase [Cuniculiplasma sp. SKW4]|uniref:menaquinone biosynthesis decarboxylase n=1 Tax=Cuniculiplasma sp. SKW4 TaxID=3400171 RepID=UPI003FCFBF12
MAYEDIEEFIEDRKKKGDLIEVEDEIDTYLELTWLLSEEEREGRGRTFLFKNPKGYEIPVVGNIFSTQEKMNEILGDTPFNVGQNLRNLIRPPKENESMIGRGLEMLRELGGLRPKIHDKLDGDHIVLDKVDLETLPICTTWPQDAAPFVTLPVVITKDPVTGVKNAGMYRMQMYDSETMGMHWQIHKDGSRHFLENKEKGKIMDVSVSLGTDPLTIFSAVAPLPEPLDEFSFWGLISKKRMDLVKGQTVDLQYPMNSEIVLEGYIDTSETRMEGPFGDHTGYYSLAEEFPVFHVKKMIQRKKPVYPTTIVGKLWHEDVIMGKAIERLFLPLITLQIPEIVDMNTMEEAVFHNMVVVSIRKRYPGHAKKVMFSIWGTGQLMFSKIVVVVDPDVDVHDRRQVLWAMSTRIDPSRDVVIIPGTHTDSLDHASSLFNYGSKMGIDATRKWKSEGYEREWPETLQMKKDMDERIQELRKKLKI